MLAPWEAAGRVKTVKLATAMQTRYTRVPMLEGFNTQGLSCLCKMVPPSPLGGLHDILFKIHNCLYRAFVNNTKSVHAK